MEQTAEPLAPATMVGGATTPAAALPLVLSLICSVGLEGRDGAEAGWSLPGGVTSGLLPPLRIALDAEEGFVQVCMQGVGIGAKGVNVFPIIPQVSVRLGWHVASPSLPMLWPARGRLGLPPPPGLRRGGGGKAGPLWQEHSSHQHLPWLAPQPHRNSCV